MDVLCKINGSELKCSMLIVSQSKRDSIFVDYGNCDYGIFNSSKLNSISYFGPISNVSSFYKQDSNFYLLLNNEFKYTSHLIGLRIFVIESGSIDLIFVSLENCGSLKPCLLFEKEICINSVIYSDLKYKFNLKKGWNEFFIDQSEKIKKGSFLLMTNVTAQIGITESFSPDLVLNGTFFTKMKNNKAFMVYSLLKNHHYQEIINFNKSYDSNNDYQIKIKLANSSINIFIKTSFKKSNN